MPKDSSKKGFFCDKIKDANMEDKKRSKSDRRRSSGTFKRISNSRLDELFKSPSLDFIGLGKKRKRHKTEVEDDTISLQSVDLNTQVCGTGEPKKKRRSSIARVTSLANLFSPVRNGKKVQSVFQRSFSLRSLISPSSSSAISSSSSTVTTSTSQKNGTPYRKPTGTPIPNKRRLSTFWHETVEHTNIRKLCKQQIERQEAIYELYKGEEDLIEDLKMVKTTYHDSMKKLGLLNDDELEKIFGHIDSLVPLHQELVDSMKEQRRTDGTTDYIGTVVLEWVPRLAEYVSYCANQVCAKALLDRKKQDTAVDDFLQRCQNSPFSRRLDLWSFLDVPRSKLVKYPLLFKSIQKLTPADHEDQLLLDRATACVEETIQEVDKQTGLSKCEFIKSRLDYLEDKQRTPLIDESVMVLCDGVLKNNRGTKLYVYLFEKVLVLTRPATRGGNLRYQVYRQPIPISELIVDDVGDMHSKMGSFKSAFTQTNGNKNAFKVSFMDSTNGSSHTLIPNDEHDKRQWLTSLRRLLPEGVTRARREAGDGEEAGPDPDTLSIATDTASVIDLDLADSSFGSMFRRRHSRISLSSLASMASISSSSSDEVEV